MHPNVKKTNMPHYQRQSRQGGALVKIVIVLVILGTLGLVTGYMFRGNIASYALTLFIESQTAQIGLSEEDQKAIGQPIGDLALKVADGEITQQQVEQIVADLAQSPTAAILGVRGFAHTHVGNRKVPAEQIKQEQLICTRFNHALLAESVPQSTVEELLAIGVEEQSDEHGNVNYRVKEELSDAEIEQGLNIMKDAADAAGIGEDVTPVDVNTMIQDTISGSLQASTQN